MDNTKNLKELLDYYFEKTNKPEFIESDPVQFPRRYKNKQDIEIAGLLSATIAWGKRSIILKSCDKMLSYMGKSPYDFIMSADISHFENMAGAVHRTFSYQDFFLFLQALKEVYKKNNSLEDIFVEKNIWDAIEDFRNCMIKEEENYRLSRHISSPDKNSACKKLHLFFRWMVRNDNIVDIGIWNRINSKDLIIPLDVHVGRISNELNITQRTISDKKTAEEITSVLRTFDPNDPVKYDFALFGIGAYGLTEEMEKKMK